MVNVVLRTGKLRVLKEEEGCVEGRVGGYREEGGGERESDEGLLVDSLFIEPNRTCREAEASAKLESSSLATTWRHIPEPLKNKSNKYARAASRWSRLC
jgi:hypothetical protein